MKKQRSTYLSIITVACYFIGLIPVVATAQTISNPALKSYLNAIDGIKDRLPIEKLYLQTDKPYYTLGDTIRFKTYLLNADYLTPAKSGLLYIELDNASNYAIKRIVVPVFAGVSWGDMALDEKDIPEGSYSLRAYTNWMRNFGEDYVFKKNIYISALSGSTLVKADFKLDTTSNKNKISANLYFSGLDKNPLRLKDMALQVKNGTHNVAHYKASTGIDGSTHIEFELADKIGTKNLTVRAHQTGKGADTANLIIPVTFNRPEKTDLQFMPEGGALVAGIPVKVGFKALSEDGKGVNISGKIIDSKQLEVATFKSAHLGMGSFEFTPQAGEKYIARVNLLNKGNKDYPLPIVNSTGTVLKITTKGNDSLLFTVTASVGTTSPVVMYNIIGQSRGVVCYAASFSLGSGTISNTLSKRLFPSGITRFTLLNQNNQPLNERLVYIEHNDDLKIAITPHKNTYTLRDSIALNLQVNDKDGKPVQGTFSLAVTDNTQVRPDSTGINLVNNMLFTSDLKGNIEQPRYYFDGTDPQKQTDLDNLLLTQGWVGYDWKKVFDIKKTPAAYPLEKEFSIQGKVTGLFKPLKQTKVMVLRKNPLLVMDTLTNNDGRFAFKGNDLLPTDSAFFFVEALNKNGKQNLVGLDVDEFIPPEFAPPTGIPTPWYVNSDTILLNNSYTKAAQLDAEANYRGEGYKLKEVVIKEKKLIPGSKNPDAEYDDVVWDQKDMDAAKKMTLLEFLQHKYQVNKRGNPNSPFYTLNGHYVLRLYLDGLPGTPTDLYVNYLTVQDIKGIEVRYIITGGIFDIVILHVTTHSGNGKFYKHTPGTYAYKPIPFSAPKMFYRPRYNVKNKTTAIGTDLRSTIHWEPNIITDKEGKVTISFFSADKAATYSVIVEGTDLKGNLGYQKGKIKVATSPLVNAELH